MQGAETTRGFLLGEVYEKLKENDKCGCSYGQINRVKVETMDKSLEGIMKSVNSFVELHGKVMQGQMWLTFAVILMALTTGGNLVWSMLKAFKIVP